MRMTGCSCDQVKSKNGVFERVIFILAKEKLLWFKHFVPARHLLILSPPVLLSKIVLSKSMLKIFLFQSHTWHRHGKFLCCLMHSGKKARKFISGNSFSTRYSNRPCIQDINPPWPCLLDLKLQSQFDCWYSEVCEHGRYDVSLFLSNQTTVTS